eukprot:874338-Pleurochrysis_carterae.AAC.1
MDTPAPSRSGVCAEACASHRLSASACQAAFTSCVASAGAVRASAATPSIALHEARGTQRMRLLPIKSCRGWWRAANVVVGLAPNHGARCCDHAASTADRLAS